MVDQIAIVKVAVSNTAVVPFTKDFTSPNITETFSAAILLFTRTNVDDSAVDGGFIGVGFIGVDGQQAEGSLQCTVGANYEDNVTVSAAGLTTRSGGASAVCILISNNAASATRVSAAYDSSIAGGVRINFTQCDDAITVTAILFAGLSKAAVGGCTHNEAGQHEDVGAAADQFSPDVVIFLPSDGSNSASSANCGPIIGFALNKASIEQIAAYTNYDNNSDPTNSDGFYRSDVASCAFIGDRIEHQDRFQITSFDSTGWNATAVDTGGANTPQAQYLALKFSGPFRSAIAHMPVAAATGTQNFNSFGFTPDLVFGMSHFLTTSNTIIDGAAAASGGYFVTGRYGSRAISASMQDGLDIGIGVPSVSFTRQGDHAVTTLDHLGTLSLQAEWLGGTGSGGFALNFTTAAQAGTLTALGIQLIPSPPLAPRRNRKPTKRSKRVKRLPALPQGKAAAQALPRFWRAIKRFRELMLRRLRKPKEFFPPGAAVFSDVVASPMADVFSAGSVRGTVDAGGAEAGDVF